MKRWAGVFCADAASACLLKLPRVRSPFVTGWGALIRRLSCCFMGACCFTNSTVASNAFSLSSLARFAASRVRGILPSLQSLVSLVHGGLNVGHKASKRKEERDWKYQVPAELRRWKCVMFVQGQLALMMHKSYDHHRHLTNAFHQSAAHPTKLNTRLLRKTNIA